MVAWQAVAIVSLLAYAWSQMDILGDGLWYIATGRYVLEHHAFPPDELFSYSGTRGPWFVNMPLSEPLFAWVTDHLGIRALLAMCTAAFGAGLVLFWLPHAKGVVARLLTWPLVFFAIYVERGDLQARSQTLSYAAFALVLLCMFRLRDGRHVPRWVPLLLGAVWVNVHPSFLLGVFVPVGFSLALRVGPSALRPPLIPILLFAALVAAGGLVNPYGYRLILEFLRFMTAESTTAIDLFRSPDFRLPEISVAVLIGAATMFACLRSGSRQAGPGEAMLVLALMTATCVSRRYVTLLVLFEIVVVGRFLDTVEWTRRSELRARWWVPIFVVPLALTAVSLRQKKDPWQHMPVEAARFIEDNGLPDNVMNVLHWGGYLDYAWRGNRRIFIDGRTTQFENGVLTDYTKIFRMSEGWETVLDVYLVNTVLWERGSPLDVALSRDPSWSLAFRKGIAVVYVRKKALR